MKLAPRYDGPSIIAIEGRPDDQLAPVTRQRRRMETMLVDLGDDDWSAPSRCDAWTVQDVVAHLTGVNDFWNASVLAGIDGAPTRILTDFDPAATPPRLIGPMRTLAPAEVLERFAVSNDAFLATLAGLDDEAWSVRAESPAGHVPIRLLAQHALWDSWVHERDVALPLGADVDEEADEVLSCLRYAAALSPALAMSTGRTFLGTFAVEAADPAVCFVLEVGESSVAVHDDAVPPGASCLRGDAVGLVEALSLRAPLPATTPDQWRQLLAGLATAFDAELP